MSKKKPQEQWQSKLGTSALNPIQVMELQDAIRKNETRVELEGRWFNITYLEDGETIHYKPEEGLVPQGYLNIDKILSQI